MKLESVPHTLIIVLALGSCSPKIYKDEVKSFADATTAAQHVFDAARAAQAQAALLSLTAVAVSDRAIFGLAIDCSKATEASITYQNAIDGKKRLTEDAQKEINGFLNQLGNCAVVRQEGNGEERHVRPALAIQGALLASEIAIYGGLLAQLAGAEDIDAVNTKSGELRNAIQSFAKSLGEAELGPLAEVSVFTEPITAVTQWVFLNYLNYKRYRDLKDAVNAAHPLLERSEPILTSQFMGLVLANLIEKERALQNRLALADTIGSVITAVGDANELAQIAKANADSVFQKLVLAHAKLRSELNNPTNQRDALVEALKEFKNHVEALAEAIGSE